MSKLKKIVLLSLVVVLAGGGVLYLRRDKQDNIDHDCSDFVTQQDAQDYFTSQGGSYKKNIDHLDGDGDGVACESNPTTAGFSFLKNTDSNSLNSDPSEPTFEDLSDPNKKTYTNPVCLDANGEFDLNLAIQNAGGDCFSFKPYK